MAERRRRSDRPRAPAPVVRLVSMPFKDLRHPPIQLGILRAALERAGIAARSHSLELAFMEQLCAAPPDGTAAPLTFADYQDIATRRFEVRLGDWIFAVPPYAEPSAADDEQYLAFARAEGVPDAALATAARMRALVPGFLRAAADELLAGAPRVIGFSTVFQQNLASLALARLLKQRDPSLTIVFGGGNCDGAMGEALHRAFPWIDVVVRGEGERVLVEVVRDVLAARPLRAQPGLVRRVEGASVATVQPREPELPVDEIPMPIYDEFFERLQASPIRDELWPELAVLFESSRGCWWGAKSHCTFCGLNGSTMKFRSKPAARVARELVTLAERYKVLDFVAVDDIIDLDHIRELLPLLRASGCDLVLFYETKSNLTKAQVHAFRAAGVSAIQPGIESLSTPILRLMRKGVTALQNIRLLKWCAELGVKPAWNLLYGFPGEPVEEYARMAALVPALVHLDPPQIMPINIERFSPYFERPDEFGIEIAPAPHYRLLYPAARELLHDLAYSFEHRYRDGRDPAAYARPLEQAIAEWQRLAPKAAGSLWYRRGPGFLTVWDRRPGFESADYLFEGVEAKLYLGCDGGATPKDLCAQLAAAGEEERDVDEIEGYLQDLVEARLMYREGNRFLSLATAAGVGPMLLEQPAAEAAPIPALVTLRQPA